MASPEQTCSSGSTRTSRNCFCLNMNMIKTNYAELKKCAYRTIEYCPSDTRRDKRTTYNAIDVSSTHTYFFKCLSCAIFPLLPCTSGGTLRQAGYWRPCVCLVWEPLHPRSPLLPSCCPLPASAPPGQCLSRNSPAPRWCERPESSLGSFCGCNWFLRGCSPPNSGVLRI